MTWRSSFLLKNEASRKKYSRFPISTDSPSLFVCACSLATHHFREVQVAIIFYTQDIKYNPPFICRKTQRSVLPLKPLLVPLGGRLSLEFNPSSFHDCLSFCLSVLVSTCKFPGCVCKWLTFNLARSIIDISLNLLMSEPIRERARVM